MFGTVLRTTTLGQHNMLGTVHRTTTLGQHISRARHRTSDNNVGPTYQQRSAPYIGHISAMYIISHARQQRWANISVVLGTVHWTTTLGQHISHARHRTSDTNVGPTCQPCSASYIGQQRWANISATLCTVHRT